MTVNPAVKVGIIVFIALVLFGVAAVFLTGYRGKSYPIIVVFDDIMGLTEGSSVTMAGVRIGRVDDIKLNDKQQAVVTLKIGREYRIPENSIFVLRVGLLVGEKSIDIIPNRKSNVYLRRNTRVVGQVPPRIEDILPDARRLVANLTEVSASLKDTLTGIDFKGKIDRSLANLESATANLDLTMAGIRDLVSAQSDDVSGIVNNVLLASESLRDLTSQLDRIAQEGRFGESIGATLASAQRAAASLERTTASLEQLVTAPDFQADIRETV
jgi:phospholipid/cholesterol/gamma-HCH transport system substrate-binding protein